MRWQKLGIVYCPDGRMAWARTHAMLPTPVLLNDQRLRVYVTFCDPHFIGRPGYVDLDARDPLRVLDVSETPLLDIGSPGTFDENGVLLTCVLHLDNDVRFLYYAGFELGTKIRYRLLTGLAVSRDNGKTFGRVSETPILERSNQELYFRSGPFVVYDNKTFKMWYVAGSRWTNVNDKWMPVYVLKYLESSDGIHWAQEGRLSLDLTDADEHGFSRPWVVKRETHYQLFYSIRKRSLGAYRLGYAESPDGITWQRKDKELGLDVSATGWDSKAIMYSAVIAVHGETYCFYNGNNFGEHGFGVARLLSL